MKLSLALFATAAYAADEQLLDDYVDMMMRQASGEESTSETDLDEAIQAKHGHGPHGHGPHGHWPHGHNPHRHCPHDHYYWNGGCSANCGGGNQQRWRQYDGNGGSDGCQWAFYHASNHACNTHACPTPYPTPFPTPFPTAHPCDDGSHGCDTSEGICIMNGGNSWRCACQTGHWCMSGCSQPHVGHNCVAITKSPTAYPTPQPTTYPTPQPTMYPTPYPTPQPTTYPTPYPTANPTPAPTAACPVTCEVDKGQFVGKAIYGYPNFSSLDQFHGTNAEENGCGSHKTASKRTADKCKLDNKKANRVVTTHNIEVINEHDSYSKHRCYVYQNKCTCECLDFAANFQEGTIQGNANGITTHKGSTGTQIDTVTSLKAAGKFWKAPSYIISADEVQAVRDCCAEEFAVNPAFILPAKTCTDVAAASDADILASLTNLEEGGSVTNTKLIGWLHEQGCAEHHATHENFEGKQLAHNGQQSAYLNSVTVDGTTHGVMANHN